MIFHQLFQHKAKVEERHKYLVSLFSNIVLESSAKALNIKKKKIVYGGMVERNSEAGGLRSQTAKRIKKQAFAALETSDLSDLFDLLGTEDKDKSASAALKAILAERMTEYTIRALKEAKRRRTKLGAATLIIAAARK